MKKIFLLLFAVTLCIAAKAQNSLYLEGTLSQNGEGKLSLMITNDEPLMMVQGDITLPAGITITGINSTCNISADGNSNDGVYTFIFLEVADVKIDANSTPTKIGEILVSCENVATGTYPVQIDGVKMANYPSANGVSCTGPESNIEVQKAAVIEEGESSDYSLEVIPFAVNSGATSASLPVLMSNKEFLDDISFSIEFPEGIAPTKSGMGYAKGTVDKSRLYAGSDATTSIKPTKNGNVFDYKLSDADFYLPNGSGVAFELPITLTSVADGVYTVKIKNISYSTCNDEGDHLRKYNGGEYYFSVFVGTPASEEEILYGHYTSTISSNVTAALKNVAIADVTAATVDEGVKFQDVLVNEKGGNSYYTRTSAEYGTTVLPLDLTTENVDELYKIASMDANSIVLTKAEDVPANTPCIFKGTINVEGATPILGVPSGQGLGQTTFKGTYEATNIDDGAGYYIAADGKFYGDGASIAPFRGYFDGAIAGVKEFRVSLVTPDGLIDITDQFSSEDIYNLQGIRVQNAKKGVNIVGGKKVYVK